MIRTTAKAALALAVVAMGLLAACGDDGADAKDAKTEGDSVVLAKPFKLTQGAGADFLPEWIARDKGFFKKYNLDVDVVPVQVGGVAWVPLVEGGQVDVSGGVGLSAPVISRANGAKVTAVASGYVTGPGFESFEFWTRSDSGIEGPADLEGKKVAVATVGATPDIALTAWVNGAGVDPASVQRITVPYPNMPTALESGQVDAIAVISVVIGPYVEQNPTAKTDLKKIGTASDALPTDKAFTGYLMKDSFIADHPNVVRAYIAAMTDAVEWMSANPADAADLLIKDKALTDPSAPLPLWPDGLCIDAGAANEWISILEGAGQAPAGKVEPDSFFTNKYNPAGC